MHPLTTPRVSLKPSDLLAHYTLPLYLLTPSVVAAYCLLTNHYVLSALPVMAIMSFVTLAASGLSAWYQTRALRFRVFHTSSEAHENYEKVLHAMHEEHWHVQHVHANSQIIATVRGFPLSWGERVEVRFHGNDVLVNSICDPGKFPSVASWGRNGEHVSYLRRAVDNASNQTLQPTAGRFDD